MLMLDARCQLLKDICPQRRCYGYTLSCIWANHQRSLNELVSRTNYFLTIWGGRLLDLLPSSTVSMVLKYVSLFTCFMSMRSSALAYMYTRLGVLKLIWILVANGFHHQSVYSLLYIPSFLSECSRFCLLVFVSRLPVYSREYKRPNHLVTQQMGQKQNRNLHAAWSHSTRISLRIVCVCVCVWVWKSCELTTCV